MNVFNLKAQVTLNTDEYKKGLQDAEKQSESSAKKIGDNFSKTSEATASQLNSIQSQYNTLVKSSGSVLTDLDNLLSNGLMSKAQYSKEYAQEIKKFKTQEQEVINRAKEMGITFENGKFKIVSAEKEKQNAIKNTMTAVKEQEKAAKQNSQSWSSVGQIISALGSNFGALGPIVTSAGKLIGEAATNAGGVWAKVVDIILKIIGLMRQLVIESIEFSDNIAQIAKQYGMTTESVSELQYIASQTHTDISNITSAMTQLERKAVNEGEVFQELGISVKDASGDFKSMEDLFFETIGTLSDLSDEEEKSAYMVQLFGRTTMESGELFRLTREEIAGLKTEANDLGLVLSEQATATGEDISKKWESLKLQAKTVMSELLLGDEASATEKMNALLEEALALLDKFLPKFIGFSFKLLNQGTIMLTKYFPDLVSMLLQTTIDLIFGVNWLKVGLDIGKSMVEAIINLVVTALNSVLGFIGVKIPKVDFGGSSGDYFDYYDTKNEYEITEHKTEEVTVKIEASGDTAISERSAEETAKALAPYIDEILGAK